MKMNNLNYYAYFLFLVVLTAGLSVWLKNIGPKGLILKVETNKSVSMEWRLESLRFHMVW